MFLISLFIGWILFILLRFKPPRGQLNCGIFGYSGSRPVDLTRLKWLAVENQSRGADSTGVYGNHLFKEKGPAKSIVLMPGFIAATKGAHTVQGHTRSASAGSYVSKDNAHPFMFGHEEDSENTAWKAQVVGAHNGFIIPEMIRYHEEHFGFKKFFPVDSQIIFAALAKTGDINIISDIEAAMAISFQMIDKHPNRLYLYRRSETRPLFIGEAPDGLYYSSLDEALRFIGCRTTWEVVGDRLYTLESGEIIDIYKMRLPTLKSLAVGVTRGSWRHGVPPVEVNALPSAAGLQKQLPASGSSNGNNQLGFGNARGFANNSQTTAKRMASQYSGSSSIDAKFNMLIKDVRDELEKLEAYPLEKLDLEIRNENHLASCGLVVNVVNQVNNKGLVAWCILADGDSSLAAMTSANGISILKIPPDKCDVPITFYAYSPVEEYGPYKFELKPEAGRVMEVTLSIPFLKKGPKKETQSSAVVSVQHDESGNGYRETENIVNVPDAKQKSLYVLSEGDDFGLLSKYTPQISWGLKEEPTFGPSSELDPLKLVIPETDLDEDFMGPSAQEKLSNTFIGQLNAEISVLMTVALDTNKLGKYISYPYMPAKIHNWSLTIPDRAKLLQYYTSNFYSEIRTSELITDASRLMQRDRYITEHWFPYWTYVELLLRFKFKDYVRYSFDSSKLNVEKYLPSTLLKKSLSSEKKLDIPAYLVYTEFLNHLVGINSKEDMTEDSRNQLRKYKRTLADLIVELNRLLLDDYSNNLTVEQKSVIRNARNLFKLEYEDVCTFLQEDVHKNIEMNQ